MSFSFDSTAFTIQINQIINFDSTIVCLIYKMITLLPYYLLKWYENFIIKYYYQLNKPIILVLAGIKVTFLVFVFLYIHTSCHACLPGCVLIRYAMRSCDKFIECFLVIASHYDNNAGIKLGLNRQYARQAHWI